MGSSPLGLKALSPHAHVIYSWLCIHMCEWLSRGGVGQGKDAQWPWSIPGKRCRSVYRTRLRCQGANSSSPLHKSALGKSSQLTDLPRFKLRNFNQEILQDSVTGEFSKHLLNPSPVSSCVSLIQKKSFPSPKVVAEKNNFAFTCFCFLS